MGKGGHGVLRCNLVSGTHRTYIIPGVLVYCFEKIFLGIILERNRATEEMKV